MQSMSRSRKTVAAFAACLMLSAHLLGTALDSGVAFFAAAVPGTLLLGGALRHTVWSPLAAYLAIVPVAMLIGVIVGLGSETTLPMAFVIISVLFGAPAALAALISAGAVSYFGGLRMGGVPRPLRRRWP